MKKTFLVICSSLFLITAQSQSGQVNIFLGTSDDHGHFSAGANAPFSLLDISPAILQNTNTHPENTARLFLGFIHNRFEGVENIRI